MRDLDTGADCQFAKLVAGGTLAAALYAGLGVGLGAMIRNQVGAIIGSLVYLFVLESLIGLIPGLDEIMPKYGLGGVARRSRASTRRRATCSARCRAGCCSPATSRSSWSPASC